MKYQKKKFTLLCFLFFLLGAVTPVSAGAEITVYSQTSSEGTGSGGSPAAALSAGNTSRSVSIVLNKKKAVIYTVGTKTVTLKATVKGTYSEVKWKSSNEKVAVVNKNGKVTAKKVGTAVITAEVNGKTAKCTVVVKKKKITKKDVYKLYKNYLSKNESHYDPSWEANKESYKKASGFLTADLNKDGLPELITVYPVEWRHSQLHIFTGKSGKVAEIKNSTIDLSSVANGDYDVFSCNKNHLHTVWSGVDFASGQPSSDERIYIIKNGKLKHYATVEEKTTASYQVIYTYTVNGRKVGKQKYQAAVGKCKAITYPYNNNAADRNKYLK